MYSLQKPIMCKFQALALAILHFCHHLCRGNKPVNLVTVTPSSTVKVIRDKWRCPFALDLIAIICEGAVHEAAVHMNSQVSCVLTK